MEWIAYQGSPEGGVSGEEKFARWWTATTCRTVNLPRVGKNVLSYLIVYVKALLLSYF